MLFIIVIFDRDLPTAPSSSVSLDCGPFSNDNFINYVCYSALPTPFFLSLQVRNLPLLDVLDQLGM